LSILGTLSREQIINLRADKFIGIGRKT
jgi:hypothetical protein